MSKRPPELTWQDKAILVVIPIVVFVIFIVANYVSRDATVADAFGQRLPKIVVRDSGAISELLPVLQTASMTFQQCRLRARDGQHEFTFRHMVQGSATMDLQIGRLIQFYGEYRFDERGGVLEVPYKGKSGRLSGWAVYENKRFYSHEDEKDGGL